MTRSEIASTALFVAAVRARENERVDRLFQDDLSWILAGPEGLAWLDESEKNPGSNYHRDSFPYLEVRTRYFDDWALEAARNGVAKQLVILGAGMDTRAFRLPWPAKFTVFEVDTPDLFALKESRLQSSGVRGGSQRIIVKSDLTSPGWVRSLVSAGFKEDTPAIWLAEGLFQYMTAKDVKQILQGAASVSAPDGDFGAEIISEEYLRGRSNKAVLKARKDRGTPWVFGTNDPDSLFKRHGWRVDQKVRALEAGIVLGRWPVSTVQSRSARAGPPGASFVTAVRKA